MLEAGGWTAALTTQDSLLTTSSLSASGRAGHDGQLELDRPPVPQHLDGCRRTDLRVRDVADELRRVVHGQAVERDDDVAGAQTALVRLRVSKHSRDQRPVGIRRAVIFGQLVVEPFDAELTDGSAPHLAVSHQV